MTRATLFAACAALVLISLACFVIGGGSEGRPTTPPTVDLQATINAALARIEATGVATAGENAPAATPIAQGLIIQPSTPIPTATRATSLMPAATAAASPTPTPTMAPPPTPSLARTDTPTPEPAATQALSPPPTRTQVPTPTAASANVEGRFDGPVLEKEIHRLINNERVKRGLPALDWDDRIAKIARDHSEDMAANDYFRHDNLKGESPTDRGNVAGYSCHKPLGGGVYSYGLAENIWLGWEYSSRIHSTGGTRYNWMSQTQIARQAVSSWMNSTGHRQNILDSQYDKTGIGVGFGSADGKPYAVYLTQNFC